MSVWTRRPALRWLVPVAAAALVIGGGAAASAIGTDDPDLPPRSAAELLVDLQTSPVGSFSGTLVQTADLGLPALPDGGGNGRGDRHGGVDFGSLLSGSNTLRVWYDGPDRARVALLGTLSQSDVIRNGRDVWVWESGENKATHWVLPDGAAAEESLRPSPLPITPQEAAEAALAAIEPTTEVSSDDTTRVAGRDAYELVLRPRDDASLIRQVRLAIDAEESMPLRVQVYGAGADPAFEVRFEQISFATPDEEQFRFNPPPGVTVTEGDLPHPDGFDGDTRGLGWPQLTFVGEGWTRVLVARLPDDADLGALDWLLTDGQVLSGPLFSVLVTEDGRLLAGLVTPEHLAEVADDPAAALPEQEGE